MTPTLRFLTRLAAAFDRLPSYTADGRRHSWYLSINVY